MSAWDWLKERLADELGTERAESLWAEYWRRAALDRAAAERRRQMERLAQARAAAAQGNTRAAQRVTALERWLDEH